MSDNEASKTNETKEEDKMEVEVAKEPEEKNDPASDTAENEKKAVVKSPDKKAGGDKSDKSPESETAKDKVDESEDAAKVDKDVDDEKDKKKETKGAENGVEKEVAEAVTPDGEMTDLGKRIVKQLLYYFGDINLPKDKFLQEQIALDDGWVPLTVLLTFKRLQAISPDAKVIASAAAKSGESLLEVSDDQTKIRRNPEMVVPEYNDERKKELSNRTAYVKGFPQDSKLETLMEFFEKYGPIEAVHMRHHNDKVESKLIFKGSVFAIFKMVDDCKKFLGLEEVKYNDTALTRQWQTEFMEEKKKERHPNKDKDKTAAEEPPQNVVTFPKGAVLYMDGFNKKTIRDNIKKAFTDLGHEPAYITFQKGDVLGHVRFPEKGEAAELFKKLTDGKIKINDDDVACRVLEGEEEEDYLNQVAEMVSKRKARGSGKWKGKRRGGGGGDGGPKAKRGRR